MTTLVLQGQDGNGTQREGLEATQPAETQTFGQPARRNQGEKIPQLRSPPSLQSPAEVPHWLNPVGSQRADETIYGSIWVGSLERGKEWVWRGKQKTWKPAVGLSIFRNVALPVDEGADWFL